MRDALIFTALTLGAIAALFPAEQAKQAAVAPHAPASPQATHSPVVVAALARGAATELARAADGHFYAPVTVGAHPITMLIDTGASVVALTGEDARLAGVFWNPAQLTVVAQGAGGAVRGVAVTVPLMRLGDHEAREVPAVVIPEGLPVSLLGQSFLKDIEPVRIEKDRMVLGGV